MMPLPVMDDADLLNHLKAKTYPHFEEYYAFYSSWLNGIVKNPSMMLIPIDDHMVHRGDGIFEALKAVGRSVYLLDEHLDRLFLSAHKIGLTIPCTVDRLKEIVIETLKVADKEDVMVRIYVSRGPGSFSANPYESIGPQIYVAITKLYILPKTKYIKGVSLGKSAIPVKEPWLAPIKSCNYLPNVMMKKEAVDRDIDFVIAVDENGSITEGATENVMIIDNSGTLVYPRLEQILKGTMMLRVRDLGEAHGIKSEMRPITIENLLHAREALLTGTTIDVLPAVTFENQPIGNGLPGEITLKILNLIHQDIERGPGRISY